MRWYIDAIMNYVNFKGRSRRRAYWMFVLMNFIIMVLLTLVDAAFSIDIGIFGMGLISTVYYIFIFLPSLALSVRRLHDTGRSGWWVLISLIPVAGFIVLLVFFCQNSYYGDNEYGPCPKEYPNEDLSYSDFSDEDE